MTNVLCFGDSNTWGYNPKTKGRYSYDIRWTGLLQKKFSDGDVRIIEEGLCGRTTVFEDETRPDRRGIEKITEIFSEDRGIDFVVIMLGTNDCKTFNHASSRGIAEGMERCLEVILEHVPSENVLLISPIHLGEKVWMDEYDPEFSRESVAVSKNLRREYEKLAESRGVRFMSAADYARPSQEDQEHLTEYGHQVLADRIYAEVSHFHRNFHKKSA